MKPSTSSKLAAQPERALAPPKVKHCVTTADRVRASLLVAPPKR